MIHGVFFVLEVGVTQNGLNPVLLGVPIDVFWSATECPTFNISLILE